MKGDLENLELNDLVRQLNVGELSEDGSLVGEAGGGDASGHRAQQPLRPRLAGFVGRDGRLGQLLEELVERGASDLLLVAREPPVLRVDGDLKRLVEPPLTAEEITVLLRPLLGPQQRSLLEEHGAVDLSLSLEEKGGGGGKAPWRFRLNVHRQQGSLAAAVRALPREIPTLADLNLPESLGDLVRPGSGLVLLCGPTGAGKSSTLAALVGEIHRQRPCHVVTIEQPVEFEHRAGAAVVEHVEVGRDSPSFSEALRAALRQDPDVILVGEMRDLDTISTALTAAETGHLVLSTLHTSSAVRAVDRIVDVFPSNRQEQVRQQLAQGLRAIVAQQLVPRAHGGGRVPAGEILRATYPVRNLVRRAQGAKLYNEMTLGSRLGMQTLEDSLVQLVRSGVLELEEARLRANHSEELEALLRR